MEYFLDFKWVPLIFSNGCFSEWLRRSQEKHSNVLCPQCRAVVQFVGRNHFLHNIEEVKSLASLYKAIFVSIEGMLFFPVVPFVLL